MDVKNLGTPTTLPSPPFVHLDGIPNFRGIGGWPVPSGQSIRRNLVFRCGEPTRATDEDVKKIQSLGVTHVFDLRSNPEIQKLQELGVAGRAVIAWPGVERIHSPVFSEQAYDPVSLAARHAEHLTDNPEGLQRDYKRIIEEGTNSYNTILKHLIANPDGAILVHCTAGKDRTGVLCALLLSFAGVSDDLVGQEYQLTEQGLGSWMEAIVRMVEKNHIITPEAARRTAGARKESIIVALQTIRKEYGDIDGYFEKKCGLSADDLLKLRHVLIVDEKPIQIAI